MSSKYLFRLSFLLLFLSHGVFAQTPTPSPQTNEQRAAQKELEVKALSLLEDVVKDSESFKNVENRIRIRATAANVLWPYDQTRARTLFKEAMASLADWLKNQDMSDDPENLKMLESSRQLRRELLEMLAPRDAKLARAFMHATRPSTSEPEDRRVQRPDQLTEVGLATQMAATDPKEALEIAEETLARGLSYELPQLISALQQKDPEGASRLAVQAMAKIRAEKLDASEVSRQVGLALLQLATKTPEGEPGGVIVRPLLDRQSLAELTEMLAAEALRPSSTSQELLSALQEMMPVVEKYAPARALQLGKRLEARRGANGEGEVNRTHDWKKYGPLYENGSVNELLDAASKAPDGIRDALYQRAAAKLMEAGDPESARQTINERVSDVEQRKQMLAQVDEMAAVRAAEQGKIDQTRKLLGTLRTNEERAVLLAQLATGAATKGDKKVALQLLDEARPMIAGRAKNFSQLGAQLAVARAYAPIDFSRSLAILEPVVDQLNELLAAAVVLGGFIAEEMVRDDEITMLPLMMISQGFSGSYLGDVKTLARSDFERTRALADRFLRYEIRTIARLLLAQSILTPQAEGLKVVDMIGPTHRPVAVTIEP